MSECSKKLLTHSGDTRAMTEYTIFEDSEPKTRQLIKIVGRTIFCFRCNGTVEIASFYCACGSFLCALHLAEHSCQVSQSMEYSQEILHALV